MNYISKYNLQYTISLYLDISKYTEIVDCNMMIFKIQDDVTGVDPSVFRRYFREEEEEVSDDNQKSR